MAGLALLGLEFLSLFSAPPEDANGLAPAGDLHGVSRTGLLGPVTRERAARAEV